MHHKERLSGSISLANLSIVIRREDDCPAVTVEGAVRNHQGLQAHPSSTDDQELLRSDAPAAREDRVLLSIKDRSTRETTGSWRMPSSTSTFGYTDWTITRTKHDPAVRSRDPTVVRNLADITENLQ